MNSSVNIKSIFKQDELENYSFLKAPVFIERKGNEIFESNVFVENKIEQWSKAQDIFMDHTKNDSMLAETYIKSSKLRYDKLFDEIGPLRGNILDIGGGWGLFRQWWARNDDEVFIVHDPGPERLFRGPHENHHKYYDKTFHLPMTFVDGFGENLLYIDGFFNTCLIAVALDHCIDPEKVVAGAYRCLAPGGTLLIIQPCHSSRLKILLSKLYYSIFFSVHQHHFSCTDITAILNQTGFSDVSVNDVPDGKNIKIFEAIK